MIIRESQLPVCRCELTLPPPGSSLSLRSFLPAFLSCPSSPSLPPPPSILRPGPFTLVTYPSPLTDTDRYQMNVFPGRRQWISGVMRHSAGTPSRHCLRVLVRLRVWSKKVSKFRHDEEDVPVTSTTIGPLRKCHGKKNSSFGNRPHTQLGGRRACVCACACVRHPFPDSFLLF